MKARLPNAERKEFLSFKLCCCLVKPPRQPVMEKMGREVQLEQLTVWLKSLLINAKANKC